MDARLSLVREILMVSARFIRPALLLVSLPLALAAQDNDPPGRAGRVSSLLGTVAFQAAGSADWSTTPLNYTVTTGDRLLTHRRSRAELEVGPFDVRLSDSTDLTVARLTDNFAQLELTRGTMRVSVYRLSRGDSMEVDTPNGAMIIRSAGRYRVDVLPGVSTVVTVEDGTIELSGPGLSQVLRRAQSVELTGSNPVLATLVQAPRQTDFDSWSADRDRRQEVSDCSKYVSRDIPGCADLSDHGRWEQHADYGYVWRPVVVTAGWVPYRSGRWIWTNTWGWTWVENTPWGFAPFHYGRWVTVGHVWVWAPGPVYRRPYYAPALVVFVRPDRGHYHQAWFPLGWREPYYPRYRHSDRYLREVNISNVRNITNVDAFIDPRRADRINYSNRTATTVVSNDGFGRRPVVHDPSIRRDEIMRAPLTRDRWEAPRTATSTVVTQPRADRPSPFGVQRRDATPRRPAETPRVEVPRERSEPPQRSEPQRSEPQSAAPLIRRNPTVGRRPDATTPARSSEPESRARPTDADAALPRPEERRPTVFRRAEPDEQRPPIRSRPESDDRPVIARRPDSGNPPAASVPDARRRPVERAPNPPARSSPREGSSSSPRESSPRESSPRASSSPPRAQSGSSSAAPPRTAARTRPPG